ncbi:hybrid sensor histidine kinase/response regulator [Halarcobacter bivalviorum]|uniref:hybrid sensor histidine kinase/response regulator n=1 Tax=Halarcobacter bivalviorum TaxID=663364 RepID=UPI00100A893D|nr:hybrid sensor histidine kinase/response regulator [Halarcobacter bivalviorum]RXK05085.1 histidine kinase [Halarcobacter bivalviorum]
MSKPLILIVDDNQANIKILVEFLSNDYEVVVSITGKDALEIIDNEKIDLILLDIFMPHMDGFEVCEKVYEKHDKHEIPIIFVTASSNDDDIEKGFNLGAVDYVTKPFRKVEILSRVKTHILLKDYKNNLESKVKEEIEKNKIKEKIMFHQSKLVSIGEMTNSIAHQWRQPLNSINSAVMGIDTCLMKNHIDNEEINEKLEEIEIQTQYMSKTIEDFSNFLNPNKHKDFNNLKEIVRKTLTIIHNKLSKNNISCNIIEKTTSTVLCTEGEIIQVLIVILNNAVDALKENSITNPKIDIEIDTNRISITDNAGGIKKDNIDNIFLPYFTTKKADEGLGIGLHLAKAIIEESNNGKLSVENIDCGAKFEIKFN